MVQNLTKVLTVPMLSKKPFGWRSTKFPHFTLNCDVILCLTSQFEFPFCALSYLNTIENALASGDTILIENLDETVDPVLDPLLGRNTIKRGR